MYDTFLSLVVPINHRATVPILQDFLKSIIAEVQKDFTDFELILVDNASGINFKDMNLSEDMRSNCYVVELAGQTSWDLSVFAGIERSNGDYTCVLGVDIKLDLGLIKKMYLELVSGSDIVRLRNVRSYSFTPRRSLFFLIMRATTKSSLHPDDRREYMLSRRALNWVVRDQTADWYMNEAILASGFSASHIGVDMPKSQVRLSNEDASAQAWSILIRSSNFLLGFAQAVIVMLLIALFVASLSALFVRFYGFDIFGAPQSIVPGWTYSVILISLGFIAISTLIYISLRVQFILLEHLQSRPRYVIKNFSRI